MDPRPITPTGAPAPAAPPAGSGKAASPRDLAVRRKRQVVGASLVAFGATVALVMTHPLTSDASSPAQTSSPGLGAGSSQPQAQPQQPLNPRAGTGGETGPGPAQPAPTFFAQPPTTSGGAAPQIRSGGGRRGSVGSGGS